MELSISSLILILYLPIVWGLVFFWAYRSKHYGRIVFACVLAHLAYSPLFGLLTEGLSFFDISNDYDIAVKIVLLIPLALVGLTISALVVLYVTRHHIWVLSILIAISVITFTPWPDGMLDEIEFDPIIYTMSILQGAETEFHGHRIYLGSTYLYDKDVSSYDFNEYEIGINDSYLLIERITPGYSGVDASYYLDVRLGAHRLVAALTQGCLEQPDLCEFGEGDHYKFIAFTRPYSEPDAKVTRKYIYNLNCDVFLAHFSRDQSHDEKYLQFIERFFNESC